MTQLLKDVIAHKPRTNNRGHKAYHTECNGIPSILRIILPIVGQHGGPSIDDAAQINCPKIRIIIALLLNSERIAPASEYDAGLAVELKFP